MEDTKVQSSGKLAGKGWTKQLADLHSWFVCSSIASTGSAWAITSCTLRPRNEKRRSPSVTTPTSQPPELGNADNISRHQLP